MDEKTEKKSLSFLDKIRAAVTNLRRQPGDEKLLECLPNLPTIFDTEDGAPETTNSIGKKNVVSNKHNTPSPAKATPKQASLKESTKKTKHKSSRSKKSEDSAPSCSSSNATSTTDITKNCTANYTNSTLKDSSKGSHKKENSQNSSGKESTKRDSNKSDRKHFKRKKEEMHIEHESVPVKIGGGKTKSNLRKQGGPPTTSGKHITIEEYRQDKAPGSASSDAYSSAKSTLSKHSMRNSSRSKKHTGKQKEQSSSSSQQSSSNSQKIFEQKDQCNKKQSKSKSISMKAFSKKNQSHSRQSELPSHLENTEEALHQPPPAPTTNTLVFVSSIVKSYKDTNKTSEAPRLPKGIKRSGTANTINSSVNKNKSTELNEVSKKTTGPTRQSANVATNRSTQPRHTSQGPTTVSRPSENSQQSTRLSNQSLKTCKPAQGRQIFNNKVVAQDVQTSPKPVSVGSKPSRVERSKESYARPKTEHGTTSKQLLGRPSRLQQAYVSTSRESTNNNIKPVSNKDVLCIFTKNQEKNVCKQQLKEKLPSFSKVNKEFSSNCLKCPNQSKSIILREYNYDDFSECSEYRNQNDKLVKRIASRPLKSINSLQTVESSERISNTFSRHQSKQEPRACEIKDIHVELESTEPSSIYLTAEKTQSHHSEEGHNISETNCPSRKEIPRQSTVSKDLLTFASKYTSRSKSNIISQKSSILRPKTAHETGSSSTDSPTQSRTSTQNRQSRTSLVKLRSRTQDPLKFSKYNNIGNTSRNTAANRKSFQMRPNTSQVIDNSCSKVSNDQETKYGSRDNKNNSQVRPLTSQSTRKYITPQVTTQSKFGTHNSTSEKMSSCSERKNISDKQSWKGRPSMVQPLTKSKTQPPSQTTLSKNSSSHDLKSTKSSSEGYLNRQIIQGQSNTSQANEDSASRTLHPSCSARKDLSSHHLTSVEEAEMMVLNSFQEQIDNSQAINNITPSLNLLSASEPSAKLIMRNLSQSDAIGRSTASWNTKMHGSTNCYSTTMDQSKLSNTNVDEKSRVLPCADTSKTGITERQSDIGLVTSYPVSRLDSDVRCDPSTYVRPSTSFPCMKAETMRCLTQDDRLLSDKTSVPYPLIRDRTYLILPSGPHDENTDVKVGTSGVPILTRQNTYLVFPTKGGGGPATIEFLHKTNSSVPVITARMSEKQVDKAAAGNLKGKHSEIPLQKETTYLVLSARAATNGEETDSEVIPLDKKTTFMILPKESSSTEIEPERSESEIRLIRTTTYEVIPSKEVYSKTEIN